MININKRFQKLFTTEFSVKKSMSCHMDRTGKVPVSPGCCRYCFVPDSVHLFSREKGRILQISYSVDCGLRAQSAFKNSPDKASPALAKLILSFTQLFACLDNMDIIFIFFPQKAYARAHVIEDQAKYGQISWHLQIQTHQNIFLIKALILLGPTFQDSQQRKHVFFIGEFYQQQCSSMLFRLINDVVTLLSCHEFYSGKQGTRKSHWHTPSCQKRTFNLNH